MKMIDLIHKTHSKQPLSKEEFRFLVTSFTEDKIPDYQMAAWLMAVCFQGLTSEETANLTIAMAESGKTLRWEEFPTPPLDKHSTGGVGDATTLLLLPSLAACDIPAAKMSGRGLGFTGGTLDKLDSIPGFQSILPEEVFKEQLKNHCIALTGQSKDLAPADGKIYALRDVTDTVQSLPLIASSIMSKKIAAGAHQIVLDVKVGSGGFMKTQAEGEKLASLMVQIGKLASRKVVAYLTSMEQPLGNYVGNGLEVYEAIQLLKEKDLSSDLAQVTLTLAGEMIFLAGKSANPAAGIKLASQAWQSGLALNKLENWISLQKGDPSVVRSPEKLLGETQQKEILATQSGYVSSFLVEELGILARDLGAGRTKKEDSIDPYAGFILHKRIGEPIDLGEKWITLHSSKKITNPLIEAAHSLVKISQTIPRIPQLILKRIDN